MKQLLAILLLGIALSTQAQIPGYQGLRFAAGYNLGLNHPVLIGKREQLPMLYHNAYAEYAIGRSFTAGMRYAYMGHNASSGKDYSLFDADLDIYNIRGKYVQHTVTAYLKYFFKRRGFIAPVGPYILMGAYYQYAHNKLGGIEFIKDYKGTKQRTLVMNNVTAHYGGIALSMGRNIVLFNRMILDFGFDLNLTFPKAKYVDEDGASDLEIQAYKDLLLRNLFQLRLGLGFLAF